MGDDPGTADVRRTYDRIAAHFSKTRVTPWPEVEAFLDGRSGAVGLDVGCGNGRHAVLLADVCEHAVGLDLSRELLGESPGHADATKQSGHTDDESRPYERVQGDAATLPFGDSVVDVAIYVATLHHLPTRDRRVRSLDELARVLTDDGRALVSAWSTEHERFDADEGFDTTVDWTLPDGEVVDRFYHIYDPEEFRRDVAESAATLVDVSVSSGNCYAVVGPEGKRPWSATG